MLRGISRPLFVGGTEDDIGGALGGSFVVGVSVGVGSRSLLQAGWVPLGKGVLPLSLGMPDPLPPWLPLVEVGVASAEELLASIVGVLLTSQVVPPSDIRA